MCSALHLLSGFDTSGDPSMIMRQECPLFGTTELDVFNTTPKPWISDIEGSHNIVEFGPVSVDCIINCGPSRGCNATSSIEGSSDAYVAGVLSLSPGL